MRQGTGVALGRFSGVFLALLGLACDPIETATEGIDLVFRVSMEQQIESTLKAKYLSEFEVEEFYFERGLNLYSFRAKDKRKPAVVFEGTYDEREKLKKNRISSDGYINSLYSVEAADWLRQESTLSKRAISASAYLLSEHEFGQSVPAFFEEAKRHRTGTTLRFNRYFFRTPRSAEDPIVKEMSRNLQAMVQKFGFGFSLYVGFWKPDALSKSKQESGDFGFESTRSTDADNLLAVAKGMDREFFVKFTSESSPPLSPEEILSFIRPYSATGPTPMVQR